MLIIFLLCSQAVSPDGEAIVTGAGDETLRFWNVFNKARSHKVLFCFVLKGLCHGERQNVLVIAELRL